MLLGTAHHFAIGSGAFREGRVFSNFEGISGWGVKTSECMVLSSCCGQQANFFSKMLTYKRAYSGVKIIIVRARPGPQLWYFLFSIGPKANGDSGCTRFLRLWSLLDFARGQGQQRRRYCHAHPPANNVSIPSYRGVEVRRPEALRASVSRTTIFIMPTRASVCSTGGRLQMVKISKRSVGN